MVDLNIDQITEEWNRLKDLFSSGAGIDSIKQKFVDFGSDLEKFKNGLPSISKGLKSVTDAADSFDTNSLGPSVSAWSDSLNRLKESTFKNNEELAVFAGKMISLTPIFTQRFPLPEAFKDIGKAAAGSTTQISEMLTTTLKLFGPELNALPMGKAITNMMTQNAERADFAKNFEQGFLMAASASGEFSKALKNVGTDLSGLSLKSEAYSNLVTNVANASGLSSSRVGEYAAMLRTIPGALDNFGGKSDMTVRDMNFLDASIKVAMGTGQSFETVMKDLTFSFDNFGTRGKKALEEVSRMQDISDSIGLPMDQMRRYTQDSASAFRLLGDNTQGAIDIMGRFGPAFQQSGMGPSAIQEVVSGITSGISKMNTAQKAFLSAQTGGSGGLQGAFQIDLAIKQGKLGDVYKKVEENLRKQFGGNIVTLDQAAGDSRSAGQFQRQIQLLRSPAMGGIAKDDDSAIRIIEAMAKGQTGTLAQKTPQDTLSNALKTGDKLEERQNSLLTQANNWAERQASIQSIIAYNTARGSAGNAGPLADYLSQLRKQSTLAGKELQPVIGQGAQGGRSVDDVMKDAMGGAGDTFSDLKDHASGMYNYYRGELNKVTGAMNEPRAIASPGEFAQKTIDRADKQSNHQNLSKNNNQSASKVDVSITTVCNVCQRHIATEEADKAAKNAINHYHDKGQVSNYHPGQTF